MGSDGPVAQPWDRRGLLARIEFALAWKRRFGMSRRDEEWLFAVQVWQMELTLPILPTTSRRQLARPGQGKSP